MFDYTVFGLKLRTDLEFLQLVPDTSEKEPDIYILTGTIPDFVMEHAGIAQQYIFHYARTCPQAFEGMEK